VEALYDKGHNVRVQPIQYFIGNPKKYMDKELYRLLVDLLMAPNILTSDFIHIEHKTPGAFTTGRYKKNIGYSVWETDRIPDVVVSNVNIKDELWTASEYSMRAFVNSGVRIPIKIIPHIIDTDKFYSDGKEVRTLIMLFNGEFTYRKGIDVLVKSYLKAFKNTDDVMLLMKTYLLSNKDAGSNYVRNTINGWIKEINPVNPPKIKILNELISDEDLPKLYSCANVFVSPTRGEGFGIPIAEAMSSQNLVIVPDKGGHTDFCDSTNSILIDSKIEPIDKGFLEEDRKAYSGQNWISPSEEHLVEVLKEVYNNYDRYRDIRIKARDTVEEYCSKDRIVSLMERNL